MALTDFDLIPTARRTLNLFFMVDTSSSMAGEKIAALNDAIRNVIPIVNDINDDNPDAEIKMNALTFSSDTNWTSPTPVLASDFKWKDLTASGFTAMGAAVRELGTKLSHKHGFLQSASGSYAPVVIMLSDGAPTDDFSTAMSEIITNNWFRHSMRIAIAIGADADIDVLKTFTGNPELVFRVHNIDALKAVIKTTVVTSSMVASRSSSVGTAAAAAGVPGGVTSTSSPGGTATSTVNKSDVAAAAMHDELDGIEGLSVGDAAMIDSLDFDDFD